MVDKVLLLPKVGDLVFKKESHAFLYLKKLVPLIT